MSFLFHTHAVMSYILALTAMGMFVHLIRVKETVHAKFWLTAFYFGLIGWQIENVIRYSLPLDYVGTWPYRLQTIFLYIPCLALTLIAHVQYTYLFLIPTFHKERKLVLKISIGLALCELALVIWNEWYNGSNLFILLISCFAFSLPFTFWSILVSMHKARFLKKQNPYVSKAHSYYAVINGLYLGASTFSLLFGFFSTPGFWSYFLFVWFGNLASIVLYIVTAAIPASFQTKVTGFTFVLAATVFTIITLTFYPPVLLTELPKRLLQQRGLSQLIAIITIVALLIVLIMPFMLKISLTKRLQQLLAGVQQVNAGRLDTQVSIGLPDEIGLLSQNFNQMTESLKKAQYELTNYAQTLEKKVSERTLQLQQSLNNLKATQAQLIQSEKMASLGELTAGIAHEIQNPLNFVNNFSEVSKEMVEELAEEVHKTDIPLPVKENLIRMAQELVQLQDKISFHGKRADAIVKSMLQHSRKSGGQKEPADINALIQEYLNLTYHGLKSKHKTFSATIETAFDPAIGKMNVVPQDIGRVLLNLFNNAFYSVSQKKNNSNNAYQPTISVSTKREGEKIKISIRDNGMGIPRRMLDKIFQPFFTTKPSGEGTGLGLSLSYDIIKAHGGELKAFSKESEGAEFLIELKDG